MHDAGQASSGIFVVGSVMASSLLMALMLSMKPQASSSLVVPLALAAVLSLSGCKVIGGIFKAGVWTGVILVLVVVALIVFGVVALMRRG